MSVALECESLVRADGETSSIIGTYRDGTRRRHLVGYVGEDVEPGVWYEATAEGWLARRDVLAVDPYREYVLTYDGAFYVAGCRSFKTAEDAIAHWSARDHPCPESAAVFRAAVEAHAASGGAS